MKKLTVIVPVYGNAKTLPELFNRLQQVELQLQQLNISLELIFVDDGSPDNSLAELLKLKQQKPDIKIIKLSRNFGAIHALKSTLPYVTGDCFMFLAADLQDPPEMIIEMAKKWLNGAKYVICVRESRADPFFTKLFSSLYYKILRLFVLKNYPDLGFDLALMDKLMLPYLQKAGKHINIPLFPYWLGFTPETLSYHRESRKEGKSSWSFGKKVKLFIDSIFGFSFMPIRIVSIIGCIVAFLSFGYGATVLISAFFGLVKVPGFAAIVTLISFLLGLVILMLGIIGEFVWRIFDEINQHPEAVIDEIYE